MQVGAAAAGVLLMLAVFLLWRRKKRRRIAAAAQAALAGATNKDVQAVSSGSQSALSHGETAARLLSEAHDKIASSESIESVVERLRETVGEDPPLAASVLRTWLEEKAE